MAGVQELLLADCQHILALRVAVLHLVIVVFHIQYPVYRQIIGELLQNETKRFSNGDTEIPLFTHLHHSFRITAKVEITEHKMWCQSVQDIFVKAEKEIKTSSRTCSVSRFADAVLPLEGVN